MREAPNWLYERLPYFYVVAGLLAASDFELTTAKAVGIVVALAGLALFRLRMRYRLRSARQIVFRLGALN